MPGLMIIGITDLNAGRDEINGQWNDGQMENWSPVLQVTYGGATLHLMLNKLFAVKSQLARSTQ